MRGCTGPPTVWAMRAPLDSGDSPTGVGVVGLGTIGGGVARNLVRSGRFDVAVCDVWPDALEPFSGTAHTAPTAGELGERCGVLLIAVVDDAQVKEVINGSGGFLRQARSGATVVILSTIAVTTVREMAEVAGRQGVGVVDCGVSGGPSAAASGQLVCMVGGADDEVAKVDPVLETFSSAVLHMGPLGAGLASKLARNVVQYGAWAAAYEGQALAEAAGIPLSKLAEAIGASEAQSGGSTALMFRDTVAPLDPHEDAELIDAMGAAAALAHKDLRRAIEMATALGVRTPMAMLTDRVIDRAFWVAQGSDGR